MTDIRTALIIGGGIAGSVAAMALQKAGIQATVYEAHGSIDWDAPVTGSPPRVTAPR